MCGDQAAVWKAVEFWEKKNPAGLFGEQGSRKSVICDEIESYLLASLVRFSLAKIAMLGCGLVAWATNPKPSLPTRPNIPAQRNPAVAGE